MTSFNKLAAPCVIIAAGLCMPAMAAPPPGSLAGTLAAVSPLLTALKIPGVGPLGGASLETVTALLGPNALPIRSIPIVGNLPITQALSTVEAVAALQGSLPGLAQLDTTLAKVNLTPAQ